MRAVTTDPVDQTPDPGVGHVGVHRDGRLAEAVRAVDSASQCVLGIGMALEVARADLALSGAPTAELAQLLADATSMTGEAVEQLRRSMRALRAEGS